MATKRVIITAEIHLNTFSRVPRASDPEQRLARAREEMMRIPRLRRADDPQHAAAVEPLEELAVARVGEDRHRDRRVEREVAAHLEGCGECGVRDLGSRAVRDRRVEREVAAHLGDGDDRVGGREDDGGGEGELLGEWHGHKVPLVRSGQGHLIRVEGRF